MRVCFALALLLASHAAFADPCPNVSFVLYRNQQFHLKLVFHEHAAEGIRVTLYSEGKQFRSMRTDADGIVDFGILPEAEYEASIPRWGKLNFLVRSERGANGPWITWSVPKPRFKTVDGKKVLSPVCPIIVAVEN